MRQIYRRDLLPKMSPHQKLIVVPGTFADGDLLRSGSLATQDALVADKLRGYRQWMREGARVIGLNAYHWLNEGMRNASGGWVPPGDALLGEGLLSLPLSCAVMAEITAEAALKTDDGATHRRPPKNDDLELRALLTATLERVSRLEGKVEQLETALSEAQAHIAEQATQPPSARHRKQATTGGTCDSRSLARRTNAAMDACCPATAGGGGHRRTQASCELPDACPSMECASVFLPFMADCDTLLSQMDVPVAQLQIFATSCQGQQASMLQPVDVQMFRVRVSTEGAAQSGAMFPGSGGSGLPPLDPLQPLPPPPAAPQAGEDATEVEQYHAECSSTDIESCVPACNAEHHGYELLATIDGTDTKFSCNLAHGLFSWVGAASEGGYLGSDSASCFSAVVGAAGSYILTLTGGAGIGTDLMIKPGQDVHISGDPGLAAAPGWGTGGFTVQQGGAFSLVGVVVTGLIQTDTRMESAPLHLTGCVLHTRVLVNLIVRCSSRVLLHSVTVLLPDGTEVVLTGALPGTAVAAAGGQTYGTVTRTNGGELCYTTVNYEMGNVSVLSE